MHSRSHFTPDLLAHVSSFRSTSIGADDEDEEEEMPTSSILGERCVPVCALYLVHCGVFVVARVWARLSAIAECRPSGRMHAWSRPCSEPGILLLIAANLVWIVRFGFGLICNVRVLRSNASIFQTQFEVFGVGDQIQCTVFPQ